MKAGAVAATRRSLNLHGEADQEKPPRIVRRKSRDAKPHRRQYVFDGFCLFLCRVQSPQLAARPAFLDEGLYRFRGFGVVWRYEYSTSKRAGSRLGTDELHRIDRVARIGVC